MEQQHGLVSTVAELIGTLRDGERGYAAAAEAARDPRFKSLFAEYAGQRSRFLKQLSEAAHQSRGEPSLLYSIAGALHRGWITLRTAVSRGDDRALLAECERGEESALHHYEKALKNHLSSSIRDLVARQYQEVKSAHDRIHYLRDLARAV